MFGRQSGMFLAAREDHVVTTLLVEYHFPRVIWPLARDVWLIIYSFIALAPDIHVI